MSRGILRKLAVLVFFHLLCPALALAQESKAGVVTTLHGLATVNHAPTPEELPLKPKDNVFYKDRISTKEQSIVRMLLGGKALITVRELSVLTITEEPGRATVDLQSGKMALAVARKLMRPGETIEIRTPTAVASVRGTVVIAEIIGSNVFFSVPSGSISVTLPQLPGAPSQIVQQGTTLQAAPTGFVGTTPISPQVYQGLTPPPPPPSSSPASGQISENQLGQAAALALVFGGGPPITPPPPRQPIQGVQDPCQINPSSCTTNTSTPTTDLSVSKTASVTQVSKSGNTLTYTIVVTNSGPDTATGVTLTDALPAGENLVSATPTQGSCSGTSTVTCSLGSLANGGTATVTIVVTTTTPGAVTNSATASDLQVDPNLSNNTGTAGGGITVPPVPPLFPVKIENNSHITLANGVSLGTFFSTDLGTPNQIAIADNISGLTAELTGPLVNASVPRPTVEEEEDEAGPSVILIRGAGGAPVNVFELKGSDLTSSSAPLFSVTGPDLLVDINTLLAMDPSTLTLGGSLLSLSSASLTATGPLFSGVGDATGRSSITQMGSSGAPLINVSSGTLTVTGAGQSILSLDKSDLTVTGPILQSTSTSTITVGTPAARGPVLQLMNTSTATTSTDPAFKISGGTLTASTLVSGDATSTLTLNGSFLDLSAGTVNVSKLFDLGSALTTPTGKPLASMTGGELNVTNLASLGANLILNDSFLQQSGGMVTTTGDAVTIGTGHTLTSGSAAMFALTGGTLTTTGSSDLVDLAGGTLTVGTGGVLSLAAGAGTTPTVNIGGDVLHIASTLNGPASGSLVSVGAGTLNVTGDVADVSGMTTLGRPLLSVSGGGVSAASLATLGANLTLQNSLLQQSGGAVTTAADALAVGARTLTSGSAAVFDVSGGTLGVGGSLLSATDGTLNLGGSLLKASGGAVITAGSPIGNVTLDFRSGTPGGVRIFDTLGTGGEVTGQEWKSRGIIFSTPTLQLNVGCGSFSPCLGADKIFPNDFRGTLVGQFVVPNTTIPAFVFSLNIDFCCEVNFPPGSTTTLRGPAGNVLAVLRGDVPTQVGTIGKFSIDLAFDAIGSLTFVGGANGVGMPLVSLAGSMLTVTGTGNSLLSLDHSDLTVHGSFLDSSDSTINVSGPVLRLKNTSTATNTMGPVVKLSGGSLTADALGISDSTGNTFDLTGTLLDLSNNAMVTLRTLGQEVPDTGRDGFRLKLALNEPAIRMANSTLNLTGVGESLWEVGDIKPPFPVVQGVVLIADPSMLSLKGPLAILEGVTSNATDPLVQLTRTTVNQTGTTAALILGSVPTGVTSTMAGPLAKISNSTINTSGPVFSFESNGSLQSNRSEPFATFDSPSSVMDPSRVMSARNFARLTGGFNLTLKGSFADATDTTFETTSSEHGFFPIHDGASLTTTGTAAPLLKFTGTAAGKSKVTAARGFLALSTNTPGAPAPSETLSGPLLNATLTTFKNGDPNSNVFTFVFVGDSAELRSTSNTALMSFDNSSVDTAGNILTLRRSTSAAAPSKVTLSGPLLSDTGSTFNTTSLGFGTAFGTSPGACCSGFSIEQGAQLASSASSALIQLNNSTFVGSDSQSGGNFFRVADTFTGAPSGELVAPASVNLTGATGSLLSATGGSISALFSLLSVQRSSLTSSGTGPLIHLGGGAMVTLGGTNPIDGSAALGDVLFLQSSPTPGTSASPASVSLAAGQILLSGNNATLTLTKDVVGVFNGATFSSSTISGLISLINTSLTAGTPSINGRMLNVAGLGGPSGTGFSTASLKKLLVSDSASTLALTGGLAGIFAGGQVTTNNSTDPFVLITGGSHSIATNPLTALFQLQGRSTSTFVETDPDAAGLVLGADQPLVHGNELLQTSGGTSIGSTAPSQSGLKIDSALLAATAPLFDLTSSTLTSAIDFVNLVNKAKLSANMPSDSLIKLNASTLTINNGSLVNVANGSFANITGNLFKVDNTSTINITGGWLVSVSSGSVFKLTGGSLGVFGSTGTNTLNITNNTALCGGCQVVTNITNLAGTKVFLGNGVSPTRVQVTSGFAPFANLTGSNSVSVSGPSGAVLAVQDPASKIVLKP